MSIHFDSKFNLLGKHVSARSVTDPRLLNPKMSIKQPPSEEYSYFKFLHMGSTKELAKQLDSQIQKVFNISDPVHGMQEPYEIIIRRKRKHLQQEWVDLHGSRNYSQPRYSGTSPHNEALRSKSLARSFQQSIYS